MPYFGPSGSGTGGADVVDATTVTAGKVRLADATDLLAGTGNDVLPAELVVNGQGETGIARVQFIAKGGTVTGTPGPWTLIIEAES